MEIKEYISSGIVESYVLGLVSPEEKAEFEQLCNQYPELVAARNSFELEWEQQAMNNTVAPPASLKNELLSQLQDTFSDSVSQPVKNNSFAWLKVAVAASLLLLVVSVYFNINLSAKNKKLKTDYSLASSDVALMKKEIESVKNNPNIKMTQMKGLETSPQASATVFWDSTSHDVYLLMNNLPLPPADKQYQIWALLDNTPIDLGMIDNEYFVKQNSLFVKAKNVRNAQAFAITLEKKGGNPTPQGTMYVMGKL